MKQIIIAIVLLIFIVGILNPKRKSKKFYCEREDNLTEKDKCNKQCKGCVELDENNSN